MYELIYIVINNDDCFDFRMALSVVGNVNLQDIWDINTHVNFTIKNGKAVFLDNRLLCGYKINRFRLWAGLANQTGDEDNLPSSNEDKTSCNEFSVSLF